MPMPLTRRHMLSALLAGTALPATLWADEAGTPFSFETLLAQMQARAQSAYEPPVPLESFLRTLSYDDYRMIAFRPDRDRWAEDALPFRASAFHPGWLFKEPVVLHEVAGGLARPMGFRTADFEYRGALAAQVPPDAPLPGTAGVKIRHPLNDAEVYDELITFLGASYFRALGRGNSYGLSARGLAINTWLSGPEEFPSFTEFWLERPALGAQSLTVYAALDSPSVTGAFRFVITPGEDTLVDVDAYLFFRQDVEQLGLGPLTSMFYFAEHSERRFDDYRLQVHDSDAVKVIRQDGDVLLRPLNNPPRVGNSYFMESGIQQFGLVQRDRAYESYEDAGARYHDRPSVLIEPKGVWGPGALRLVEIPAELEIDDNIVLFWVPEAAPRAGETRNYAYRMRWGALTPKGPLAWVRSTRTGVGGPSGLPIENPNWRKFVVDFEGGDLGALPADADVAPVASASAGTITGVVLHKIDGAESSARWRLVIDIDGGQEELIELSAHVAGLDRKLTETWLFQWLRTPGDT